MTKTEFPKGYALEALGDFVGRGEWTFTQISPAVCEVVYDWQIAAEKPFLKCLTSVLRPLFSFNHEWAMRKGEQSLKLELLHRRAKTDAEFAKIAPPPGPTFPYNLLNNKIL